MRGKEVSFALQDRHVGLAATPEFNNFLLRRCGIVAEEGVGGKERALYPFRLAFAADIAVRARSSAGMFSPIQRSARVRFR